MSRIFSQSFKSIGVNSRRERFLKCPSHLNSNIFEVGGHSFSKTNAPILLKFCTLFFR